MGSKYARRERFQRTQGELWGRFIHSVRAARNHRHGRHSIPISLRHPPRFLRDIPASTSTSCVRRYPGSLHSFGEGPSATTKLYQLDDFSLDNGTHSTMHSDRLPKYLFARVYNGHRRSHAGGGMPSYFQPPTALAIYPRMPCLRLSPKSLALDVPSILNRLV